MYPAAACESESPQAAVAPPTPAQIPTVTGETVVYFQKTNKKGKPQGKKMFSGFKIQYSTRHGPGDRRARVQLSGESDDDQTKKNQMVKSLTPVHFTATYDASSDSVTLKIIGKNPFAKGGQITIVTSPPTGVSSQLGVALSSSYTSFKISANAKQITLA